VDTDLARVSIIGVGMRSHHGVAAQMFDALAAEKINIEGISTSEIVISTLVRAQDSERRCRWCTRRLCLTAQPVENRSGAPNLPS